MEGRVRVRRLFGFGPVYIPESKRTVHEGEEYELPLKEAEERIDWEIIEEPTRELDR